MKIVKRSGAEEDFSVSKILAAVTKANQTVEYKDALTAHQIEAIGEHVEGICRALDRALDLMLRTEDFPEGARFHWTQEVTWGLRDWWERSSPERRSALIRCAQKGQYEVCAFPFSSTPCMDRTQWAFALKWLPEEISRHFPFSVGMQTADNMILDIMVCK